MDSENQILESLIEDLEANRLVLPTLPEVALKVRDAVDDANASFQQDENNESSSRADR